MPRSIGVFFISKNPQRSWGVRLKAKPYTKATRQGGFRNLIRMTSRRIIKNLSHCYYELKYHLVWTPKYRGKVMSSEKIKGELRRMIESICKWKHWEIMELNIQDDHVHMRLMITPRESISYVMQVIKGKSSAWMKKKIKNTKGLYERNSLWARGYFVTTIGINEMIVRRYVRHQYNHNEVSQPSLFDKLIN